MKLRFIIFPILLLLTILTLLYAFPDTEEFSVYNNGPTGLSDFYHSFNNVSNSNITILIILHLNNINYTYFANYLLNGGVLIITGNHTLVNIFMKNLGISMLEGNTIITNNLNYYKNNQILLYNYDNLQIIFPYSHDILGGNAIVKLGKFDVVDYTKVGNGEIIMISSKYFFINKYYQMYDNSEFLHKLTGTNNVRILIFNKITTMDYIKEIL